MSSSKIDRKQQIKFELIGIAVITLSLIMLVSVMSPNAQPLFLGDGGGAIGSFIARILGSLTGEGKYLLPIVVGIWGLQLLLGHRTNFLSQRSNGIVLLFISILATIQMVAPVEHLNFSAGWSGHGGGIFGVAIYLALTYLFGTNGSIIVVVALYVVSIILITKASLTNAVGVIASWLKEKYLEAKAKLINFIFVTIEERETEKNINKDLKSKENTLESSLISEDDFEFEEIEFIPPDMNQEKKASTVKSTKKLTSKESFEKESSVEDILENLKDNSKLDFVLPPLSILQRNIQLKSMRIEKDITEKVKLLEETLASFSIAVKVNQVSKGPAITRFEMQPAPGIKVSKIVNLADDIALALAASSVRIEAPIPGKAAVGIEIPNKEIGVVTFREVIETEEFQQAGSKISIALGKDIAGSPVVANLQSMPHLLIAGATGAGKSVCMNTIIASLLYKAKPTELKLLMVDPKMVELTNYNGIPHLISPVVTDSKKAAASLKWVVEEMESRYELFAKNSVKDITRFNKVKSEDEQLPYIVVLIDELADLMMVAPVDVEDAICRLAQMARAAGIHLVVATQRPSVDVITGLIKANIPSRIAFAVSSQTDSRTILDMGGAEKLLGRGDMLYYPTGSAKPQRVQGCFLSDKEVEDIVTFLKHQGKPEYLQGIIDTQGNVQKKEVVEDLDPLFYEAAKLVIEHGQASISMLQRRLHIGYNRAARLVDLLEENNIIGGYEGNKPRNILMSIEQLESLHNYEELQEEIQ
ncbi:MAG: DNA translocase FtsK [Bacillota bacterium]|nr:DNA translocase FtsK [Bacillota bacterium]